MYQAFYQLLDKPFKLTPDVKFFYSSHGHKRALSYLQYGIAQAEGFVVITGDIGSGKTTLIQELLSYLEKDKHIVVTISSTNLGPDELIGMIAASLNLEYDTELKVKLLKTIEKYVVASASEDKRILIIVDEAQNLPVESLEELRMLSNIQVAGASALQIMLLGQPELSTILNKNNLHQLKQRIIASYHLSPMSRDETEGYINYRLELAGRNTTLLFTIGAYDAIFKYTGGVPRLINIFCDRLLLFGYLEKIHAFEKHHVESVVSEIEKESLVSTRGSGVSAGPVNTVSNDAYSLLEGRIDRLESKMNFITDLIKRMLNIRKSGES